MHKSLYDPAIPLGIWIYLYAFTSVTNYVFEVESSGLTIASNLALLVWAFFSGGVLRVTNKYRVCLADILVLMISILIVVHRAAVSGMTKASFSIALNILVGYYLTRRLRGNEIASLLRIMFVCGFGVMAIAFTNLPQVWDSWQTEYARPLLYGSRANTVIFAYYVGLFAVHLFAILQRPINDNRVNIQLILLLVGSMLVLVAFSGKTTLAAVSIIGGVLIVASYWSPKRLRIFWFCGFVAVGTLFLARAPEKLLNFYAFVNVKEIIEATSIPIIPQVIDPDSVITSDIGVDENNSMAIRIMLIRNGFYFFRESFLFGYGPDKQIVPHSTIIQIFYEYGIVAGAAFVALLLQVISKLKKIAYDTKAVLRNEAWILMAVYIYVVIYDQVLGSVANLSQFFILTGAAVTAIAAEKRLKAHAAKHHLPSDSDLSTLLVAEGRP